jgi:DedD protein
MSSVPKTRRPASSTAIKETVVKETRKRVSNAYNVQVGAFENTVRAELLSKSLGANGYKVSITKYSPVAGKVFSRVRIGPYASRKEADDMSSTLKSQGLEGLIITGLR